MNRLIKAEWYRVRNSYHMLLWTIIFCLFFAFIEYVDISSCGDKYDGITAFNSSMEMMMVVICYIPMFVGGMYVASYENKTLNYEVMIGYKPWKIIASKLITCVPIVSSIIIVLASAFYFWFGVQNGFGQDENIGLKLSIFALIAIKIVTCAILIMMVFKSAIGLFVIFFRFMIAEGMGLIVLEMLFADGKGELFIEKWGMIFVQQMVSNLALPKISSQSIKYFIAFTLIEIMFWLVLAYNSYKRKWFS